MAVLAAAMQVRGSLLRPWVLLSPARACLSTSSRRFPWRGGPAQPTYKASLPLERALESVAKRLLVHQRNERRERHKAKAGSSSFRFCFLLFYLFIDHACCLRVISSILCSHPVSRYDACRLPP